MTFWTLKRRSGAVAVLCDHQLVLSVPAPTPAGGTIRVGEAPKGMALGEVRYRSVEALRFGDDFMRPEALDPKYLTAPGWREDAAWKVEWYDGKERPGEAAGAENGSAAKAAGGGPANPWQLSCYPSSQHTTNGFWFLYTGVGPSWTVANRTLFYSSRDRYFVEAAVKPDYDSEVGVIAGYQDAKNYLLFRWRSRDAQAKTPKAARAELVAVVNGVARVLASSPRGFDPEQWYRLRLNLGWHTAQALVDDKLLLQAANPGPVEGRIGLYANGARHPARPGVDAVTATMFQAVNPTTGQVYNDAADAQRTTSCIYFDDVRAGDWHAATLTAPDYAMEQSGQWERQASVLTARAAGQMLLQAPEAERSELTTRVQLPKGGRGALLLREDAAGNGYAWELSEHTQTLYPVKHGRWGSTPLDSMEAAIAPGTWADARVEMDGPYLACFLNGARVLEHYNPAVLGGGCGIAATAAGLRAADFTLEMTPTPAFRRLAVHSGFADDKWLATWASDEADWYPANPPGELVTPAGAAHELVGASAPFPTDQPGLYWHKGGHYDGLRVTIPLTPESLAGQALYLSPDYRAQDGYRLTLEPLPGSGTARLWRQGAPVGAYPFPLSAHARLVFERRGAYLFLRAQQLDAENPGSDAAVLESRPVFAWRDPHPLAAERVGFAVTDPALPAAALRVESDRIADTFEQAPAGWVTQSGVWAVMARYSCNPTWNWFGGFGAHTPTAWSKWRLDGDQTVEFYLGVKMLYDQESEGYLRRFRDLNVTICADGAHLNSGYTVIRGGRPEGRPPVIMLLRNGVIVQQSRAPAHIFPAEWGGHRQWFATRLEKHGAEIKVYLDNRLAMSYTDPQPLPGGYTAAWTLDNGMMVGRANLSAQRMTLGTPRAAQPIAVQQPLAPVPTPGITLNGQPVHVATFEADTDGWEGLPGMSARLVRERSVQGEPNTWLTAINSYPAGDFAARAFKECDLAVTPLLHFDYCFDKGARINLYLRKDNKWYGILLTGGPSQNLTISTAGEAKAVADGTWHHLGIDLASLLQAAVTERTGAAPADLQVQEIVIGEWSTPTTLRWYGFGENPGGMAVRFDNAALLPAVAGPITLRWEAPGMKGLRWMTGLDTSPAGAAKTAAANSITIPASAIERFFHLQAYDGKKAWGAAVHLPVPVPYFPNKACN